jgi:uncharacterized protein YbjT (DUF2867 family)
MILVTGATGFVGQRVVARLVASGYEVRCLVRPAYKERRLPPGVRVHLVTGDLDDPPALRVALQRVETIIHLATIWRERGPHTFDWVNHQGTLNLIEAAHEVGASRIILLSYPSADGNSAYAFLRSKGLAEEAVKSSGLRFTILRPSWVYGPGDAWTTHLAMVLKSAPFVFPVVGDGQARLQPQCLENQKTVGQTYTLGGPGYLTLNDVLDIIAKALKVHRRKVHMRVPLARTVAETMERMMPQPLLTTTMVDLLGVDATTDISSVMRSFGFEPARFAETLDYLRDQPWRRRFWGTLLGRQ